MTDNHASETQRIQATRQTVARRTVLQVTGGTALAAFLAACSGAGGTSLPSAGTTTNPAHSDHVGGTLAIGFGGNGTSFSLDPADGFRLYEALSALYSYLAILGPGQKPVPDLATSWETNATADEWTFHLRPNVKFHDGRPVTGADVKYSLARNLDPKVGSAALTVLSPYMTADGITTPDAATVVIKLKAPQVDLPTLLTSYQLAIIPEGSASTIAKSGIGSGPFKLASFAGSGTTTVVANPDYYLGRPQLDEIKFIQVSDSTARVNALISGDVDLLYADPVSAADATRLQANSNITVWSNPSADWSTLVMNCEHEPFTDVRVRQAFKAVVDEKQVLTQMMNGRGSVAGNVPVGLTDQFRADVTSSQDIGKAKELLAAAGYPDGLDITLDTSTVDPTFMPMVLTFQQQAKAAGIRVKIEQHDPNLYWDNVWLKNTFYASQWGDRPAPVLLNLVFRSGGPQAEGRWKSPEFDALLDKAAAATDEKTRLDYYAQAQRLLASESGNIIPVLKDVINAGKTHVRNYPGGIVGRPNYHTLAVEG